MNSLKKKERLINKNYKMLVDAVCDLSIANTYTGIWDNRRHQMCKNKISKIFRKVSSNRKLSRSYVEKRAVNRNIIEDCIVKFSKTLDS